MVLHFSPQPALSPNTYIHLHTHIQYIIYIHIYDIYIYIYIYMSKMKTSISRVLKCQKIEKVVGCGYHTLKISHI